MGTTFARLLNNAGTSWKGGETMTDEQETQAFALIALTLPMIVLLA